MDIRERSRLRFRLATRPDDILYVSSRSVRAVPLNVHDRYGLVRQQAPVGSVGGEILELHSDDSRHRTLFGADVGRFCPTSHISGHPKCGILDLGVTRLFTAPALTEVDTAEISPQDRLR